MSQPANALPRLVERTASAIASAVSVLLMLASVVALMAAVS
jgi:hypothetical protein